MAFFLRRSRESAENCPPLSYEAGNKESRTASEACEQYKWEEGQHCQGEIHICTLIDINQCAFRMQPDWRQSVSQVMFAGTHNDCVCFFQQDQSESVLEQTYLDVIKQFTPKCRENGTQPVVSSAKRTADHYKDPVELFSWFHGFLQLKLLSAQEDICVGDFVIVRGDGEKSQTYLSTPYWLAKVVFTV